MENNDKLKALAGKRAEVSEDEMNSVCGGLENLGRFPEEDYDIVYKKDGEKPEDISKPGEYNAVIT